MFIPYAEWQLRGRVHLQLAFFCIAGAAAILWALVPRPDRFTPPGPLLEEKEHPQLFANLREVAEATGQQMPAEVYLVPDVNAWVSSRGGIMGFGSRRVMGIGLGLLPLITVSQLRAVLAHEFGHYYGGDTGLGPWIYKTRAAIGRTLFGLGDSLLQKPFLWYGNFFLRITHGISRRQEFVADALAARVVGARPLIEGLRAIHSGAAAFSAYWESEFVPVLEVGYRPPLVEGFTRFLAAPSVADAVAKELDRELREGVADPYDTHPTLAERIAAAEHLPPGVVPQPDPPAITLLGNIPKHEAELFSRITATQGTPALKPLDWEATGPQVLLPMWTNSVRRHRQALAGITAATLPNALAKEADLGRRVVEVPEGVSVPAEAYAEAGRSFLTAAFAAALGNAGWAIHSLPGEPILCKKNGLLIEPAAVLSDLSAGKMSAEAWQVKCTEAGIGDLDLSTTPL